LKEFCGEAQERREEEGTLLGSLTWRKALKGEAQGCWGLKEASEGRCAGRLVERVAKPESGAFVGWSRPYGHLVLKAGCKMKGTIIRKCRRVRELQRGAFF
jgi:hypothetical protein